jgi:glucose-1-phosphate thymidylyltransferase
MDVCGIMVVEDAQYEPSLVGGARVQALEHIANRPIAHHVLDALRSAGVDEFIIVANEDLAELVRARLPTAADLGGRSIRLLTHPGPVDLAGALTVAAPAVGGAPCIVHSASGLLGEPLAVCARRMHERASDAVVFVHQGSGAGRHLSAATRTMLRVAELDPQHAALSMAGVCLFGRDALAIAAQARWDAGGDVDLTEVGERIAAGGGRFEVLPVDTWRGYSGDPADLLELNRIALDGLVADVRWPGRNGNQIEGRVWIHEEASVSSSVIVGPTVIGSGACITDAYIGPYTSVGEGVRIEGAEIERSIIACGASIMHIGGRIVASVVGRDARIFRDFSLPRALRFRVGDGTEVALC